MANLLPDTVVLLLRSFCSSYANLILSHVVAFGMIVMAFTRIRGISGQTSRGVEVVVTHISPLSVVRKFRHEYFQMQPSWVGRMRERGMFRERPIQSSSLKFECPRETAVHGTQETEDGFITDPLVLICRRIDQILKCVQYQPFI